MPPKDADSRLAEELESAARDIAASPVGPASVQRVQSLCDRLAERHKSGASARGASRNAVAASCNALAKLAAHCVRELAATKGHERDLLKCARLCIASVESLDCAATGFVAQKLRFNLIVKCADLRWASEAFAEVETMLVPFIAQHQSASTISAPAELANLVTGAFYNAALCVVEVECGQLMLRIAQKATSIVRWVSHLMDVDLERGAKTAAAIAKVFTKASIKLEGFSKTMKAADAAQIASACLGLNICAMELWKKRHEPFHDLTASCFSSLLALSKLSSTHEYDEGSTNETLQQIASACTSFLKGGEQEQDVVMKLSCWLEQTCMALDKAGFSTISCGFLRSLSVSNGPHQTSSVLMLVITCMQLRYEGVSDSQSSRATVARLKLCVGSVLATVLGSKAVQIVLSGLFQVVREVRSKPNLRDHDIICSLFLDACKFAEEKCPEYKNSQEAVDILGKRRIEVILSSISAATQISAESNKSGPKCGHIVSQLDQVEDLWNRFCSKDSGVLRNIAVSYYNTGATLFNQRMFESAADFLQNACRLFMTLSSTAELPDLQLTRRFSLLATCLTKMSRFGEALDALKKAAVLEASPATPDSTVSSSLLDQYVRLSQLASNTGSLSATIAAACNSLSEPSLAKMFHMESQAHRRADSADSIALSVLDEALKKFPEEKHPLLHASFLLEKAIVLSSSSPEAACTLCDKVLALRPSQKRLSDEWRDIISSSQVLQGLCAAISSRLPVQSALDCIQGAISLLQGIDSLKVLCPQRSAELLWTASDFASWNFRFECALDALQIVQDIRKHSPELAIDVEAVECETLRCSLLSGRSHDLEEHFTAASSQEKCSSAKVIKEKPYSLIAASLGMLHLGQPSDCISILSNATQACSPKEEKLSRQDACVMAFINLVRARAFRIQMRAESSFEALSASIRLWMSAIGASSAQPGLACGRSRSWWFMLNGLLDSIHDFANLSLLRGAGKEAEYVIQYGFRTLDALKGARSLDHSGLLQAAKVKLHVLRDDVASAQRDKPKLDELTCVHRRTQALIFLIKGDVSRLCGNIEDAADAYTHGLKTLGVLSASTDASSEPSLKRGRAKAGSGSKAKSAKSAATATQASGEWEHKTFEERSLTVELLLRTVHIGHQSMPEVEKLLDKLTSSNCDILQLAEVLYYRAMMVLEADDAIAAIREGWFLSAPQETTGKPSRAASSRNRAAVINTTTQTASEALPRPLAQAESLLLEALRLVANLGPTKLFSNLCNALAMLYGRRQPRWTAALIIHSLNPALRHQAVSASLSKLQRQAQWKSSTEELVEKLASLTVKSAESCNASPLSFRFEGPAFDLNKMWLNMDSWISSTLPPFAVICVAALAPELGAGLPQSLLLLRLSPSRAPVVLNIPLQQESSLFKTLDIVKEASRTATSGGPMEAKADKLAWWSARDSLELELSAALGSLESDVLGPWKCILAGLPNRGCTKEFLSKIAQEVLGKFAGTIDHHLAEALIAGSGVLGDAEIVHALNALGLSATETEVMKIATNIKGALCRAGTSTSAPAEASSRSARSARTKKRAEPPSDAALKDTLEARETVLLVLATPLDGIPWENLPFLRQQNVCRLPSLHFLPVARENRMACSPCSSPGFFVVNPSGDLGDTQATLGSMIASLKGWEGISGRAPSTSELKEALAKHSTYLYCGHGCGDAYIRNEDVEQLEQGPLALLMGCSSAALGRSGCLDLSGAPVSYILGGSPGVIGALWDVTDRDLDRYSEALLTSLTSGLENLNTNLEMHTQSARQACKLRLLVGAAPVCYGFPASWL